MSGVIIALIFLIIDFRVSLGIVLGLACYALNILIISDTMSDAIEGQAYRPRLYQQYWVRMMLLSLPLLMGFVLPQYVSVWGAFSGLMMFKITLYVYGFIRKE
ncbi:MAG: ATP synthase subunit I [Erysipelotrichaceae bacterium]|nr:ATP synthase subunit I [Erysipelotrichaceae bacterium]